MEPISQRQLRNESGAVLRRAAAGEVVRVRAGDTVVELRRASASVLGRLEAVGLLTPGQEDDFADFPSPAPGLEPLEETLDALRGER